MLQPAMKPVEEHSPSDIIARIGSLTRMLRDSLRELVLDQAIAEAAEAIPDARDGEGRESAHPTLGRVV